MARTDDPALDDPTRYEQTAANNIVDESNLPPERRNRPPGAPPGRWLGNQWIPDSINMPPPGAPPGVPGHYENEKWVVDPVVETVDTPAAPPTTTTQTTTNTSSGGGGGGGGATTNTSVSSVYQNIIQQLLNTTGPSGGGGGGSSLTAPVRATGSDTFNVPAKSEFDKLVHDQILKLLGGPTPEEIGKQAATSLPVNAYRNSMLRDLEVKRARAAEEAGITGTDASGGFLGNVQGLKQAAGESTAKFTGEYVDKAMSDRRAELQRGVEMAQKQGNFEDQQSLQAEIARLQHNEEMYRTDVTKYGAELNAEVQREANANQRFKIEVDKLLGMSDQELRKYIADKQFEASMSASGSAANSASERLVLDWAIFLAGEKRKDRQEALDGPGKV
jgi:hypothetical protein